MKLRIKEMIRKIRKQKHNQSEHQEEKRIQKNEVSIRSLWTTSRGPTFTFTGVPGEEKEQEIGNLFEK